MTTETQTGTLADTQIFQDFYDYVIDKYKSMGNFSMIATGKRNTYSHIEYKADNEKNTAYIEELNSIARALVYDKTAVYISKWERLNIYHRVEYIVKDQSITKVQYFRDIHISINIYKQIVSRVNIYKNESYKKLIKILEL